MKFWIWGPTTIWHKIQCAAFFFFKITPPYSTVVPWKTGLNNFGFGCAEPFQSFEALTLVVFSEVKIFKLYSQISRRN